MSFTHLHVHTIHSLYHSTLAVEEAVDKAIQLGMNALAITNYDQLCAAHDFVQYAHKVAPHFKPIIGCEMHVGPVNHECPIGFFHKAPHLTMLCKNEVGYFHKHRYSIELDAINLHSGVAEVMNIVVETICVCAIKAVVMVAADEYLMPVWEVAEPVKEIERLLLATSHSEVTGMHHHISLGLIPKPMMAAMCI